ncbi:MAG TPA: LamG domain-containing protein, partial [Chromatiales bacterium]|nr:LamG domain-containing protein [Chromatiales bacterium]
FKPSQYVRLYIDGVLVAEDTTNIPASIAYTARDPLTIGRRSGNPQSYFDGLIDEVRIYDQALDQPDIQTIMAETHPCSESCSVSGDYRLFQDDFDDGDYAGWTVHRFRNKGCGWRVEGGRLTERRNSCFGFLGWRLGTANAELRDYVLKTWVEARPDGVNGGKSYNNGVGLVFGYRDDANYYLVRWRDYGSAYSGSGVYRDFELLKVSSGRTTILDRKPRVTLPDAFHLTVDVGQGNGIDVFVDCDNPQFRLHADGEYPPLEVFGPYTYDNDTGVQYDDIEVYGKQSLLPAPYAEWRLDETGWTGAAGEVQDSSGNGHPATAKGGVGTVPGKVCRGGDFKGDADGRDDYLDAGSAGFDQTGELTVAAWVYARSAPADQGRTVVSRYRYRSPSDQTGWNFGASWRGNYFAFHVHDAAGNSAWATDPDFFSTELNRWKHVVGVFKPSQYVRLYIDGVLVAEDTTNIPASIAYTARDPLTIGRRSGSPQSYFDGLIDEVNLFDQALSPGQVRALMRKTHPCQTAALDHFALSHDGAGIFCATETVLLAAMDINGEIFEEYTGTVTLDTQTGSGTWVATTGDGALNDAVANDGKATYTFVPSDKGVAAFTLSYPDGPRTFNIDAYDGVIRDDDSEGDYLFSPNGFLMTAHPVSNPPPATINDPIPAQTAASDFQVHLTAYGRTPTHPQCGVIEDYTGDKRLRIWGQYRNPATGAVEPTVNGVAIPMGVYNREQHLTFTAGKASFTAKYKDAGRIRLRVYDLTEPDVIAGATNDFTVKPDRFRIDSMRRAADGFDNPAAVDAGGPRFTAAGMDFRVELTAVDAEGDATPNFGRESPAEGVKLAHTLVAPAGGASGNLTGRLSLQGNGVFAGNVNWSEVGIIRLDAGIEDGDYLGAGDVNGRVDRVGRFTPHHFTLSGGSITNRSTAGCAVPSSFTYMDEPFGIGYSLEARNLLGGVTQNYAGAFAKLDTVAELNYGAVDLT